MTPLSPTPLQQPRRLAQGALRVVPLSGLGEVGRNMNVLEIDGRLLIIDCGTLFPEDHQPGVDLILPDFSYIADRLDDVIAVVLTHAHEDHIGAVPYLLRLRPDIPLVGSPFTLALVEAKLKEHRISPYTLTVQDGQREQLGPFEVEFIPVTHSIPEAMAVAVRTTAGTLLHTGDFKLEQLPRDGRVTDLNAFARIGDEGLDLFMCDSTNSEVPGVNISESELSPVFDRIMATAPRKVVVGSFASNVHRVQMVIESAMKNGRKVCFLGRSMLRNMAIAQELGYLDVPDGTIIDVKDLDKTPDRKIAIICTGSQGEALAALSRMAQREHRVELGQDDTVVFSSSVIPGNENAISTVINGLMSFGVRVVTNRTAKVHVSGHATAGELLTCYNVLKPKHVMPVHGEVRHQHANAELARRTGTDPKKIIIGSNGTVVDLENGVAKVAGQVASRLVYVDGSSVGAVSEDDLKDRRVLSGEGFISIFVVVDAQTGKVIVDPEITVHGVPEEQVVFDRLKPKVVEALAEAVAGLDAGKRVNTADLQQVVRRVVGRWASTTLRRKPMILPVVVEA